jgi:diguanylate cyclase (GGDEF)-like protein
VHFRLTNLDPVRPANAPEPLERQYLERFAQGEGEQGEILGRGADREFFYMAPLYIEQGCLRCHEQHGYSLGELRGAITIEVPMRESVGVGPPLATHSAMLLAGYGLIFLFFSRLRGDFDNVAFLAEHDGLTGLYNRAAFDSALASEFARSSRGEAPLSLLMLDLDRFKAFNDHCGHLAGDGCLRRVAAAIRDSAQRPGDQVFRYGGEEFAVLLPGTSLDAARTVAERALAAVARAGCRWLDGDVEQVVTTSIGVAVVCGEDADPASLIARADAALYAAKRAGRNCYVLGTD